MARAPTFAKMSDAVAIQMNGFGWSLCRPNVVADGHDVIWARTDTDMRSPAVMTGQPALAFNDVPAATAPLSFAGTRALPNCRCGS
jgi:hypothetical protein